MQSVTGENSTTGRCPDEGDCGDGRGCGTAGMTLVERPEPPAAINDVIVQIHASGFVPTEMEWPSTAARRGVCSVRARRRQKGTGCVV
jgi:hypothetical protein